MNGEQRQNSNARHLFFNVFGQIALPSNAMTLEPGDLIFTGTPGGVGLAMKPPRWLKAGDKVRVEMIVSGYSKRLYAPKLYEPEADALNAS